EAERAAGRVSSEPPNPLAAIERAALRDTDPNLQETARIEKVENLRATSSDVLSPSHDRRSEVISGRASDVLSTPPPAPEPPLIAPPRVAQESRLPTALPVAAQSHQASPVSFSILAPTVPRSARPQPSSRYGIRANSTASFWMIMIGVVVVIALLV